MLEFSDERPPPRCQALQVESLKVERFGRALHVPSEADSHET
jgi:hypothetical protein